MEYQPNVLQEDASGNAECLGFIIPWQDGQLNDAFRRTDGWNDFDFKYKGWDLTVLVAKV